MLNSLYNFVNYIKVYNFQLDENTLQPSPSAKYIYICSNLPKHKFEYRALIFVSRVIYKEQTTLETCTLGRKW